MPKKQANPIDVQVGNRVRIRRMLIGMSQERLGDLLGLTFQQVQKYERGLNRISASKLFEISRALKAAGKEVFLANLSFSALGRHSGRWLAPKLVEDTIPGAISRRISFPIFLTRDPTNAAFDRDSPRCEQQGGR